jgi:hypothetical protein
VSLRDQAIKTALKGYLWRLQHNVNETSIDVSAVLPSDSAQRIEAGQKQLTDIPVGEY